MSGSAAQRAGQPLERYYPLTTFQRAGRSRERVQAEGELVAAHDFTRSRLPDNRSPGKIGDKFGF
jgi:hypothetical protein